jgi:hypothetical protein
MCTHLQGKYTKTSIGKALEKLIDQDMIVSKTFGKAVIYTVKQVRSLSILLFRLIIAKT